MRIPPRAQIVLEFLRDYHRTNGISPALSEIAKHLDTSVETARAAVIDLEQLGVIARNPRVPRSIRIINDPKAKES